MVYLLHFNRPYKHARHYIGFTTNLGQRMHAHELTSQGARLLQVASAAGIKFEIARTWEGDRKLERKLKNRKKASRLCPICLEEMKRKKAGA